METVAGERVPAPVSPRPWLQLQLLLPLARVAATSLTAALAALSIPAASTECLIRATQECQPQCPPRWRRLLLQPLLEQRLRLRRRRL